MCFENAKRLAYVGLKCGPATGQGEERSLVKNYSLVDRFDIP